MRDITAQDTALLNSPHNGARTWIKVEMTRDSAHTWGSESWVDLTQLNGYDWVLGCEYSENIDTPAWTARVRLLRQIGDNPQFSLSPFISSSVNNIGGVLVQPYRKIRISTAVVPMDVPRNRGVFNVVFVGRVSSYSMNEGEITLTCHDRTHELQNFVIRKETGYGSHTPVVGTGELNDVIQEILDDHYNTDTYISGSAGSPYTLYSANGDSATPWNASDDTAWAMRFWVQQKVTVWEAIQTIVNNLQYQLRFRWHEGSTGNPIDDFVLVCENPDRAKTTADFSLNPISGVVDINSVSLDSSLVRNYIHVGYALYGGLDASTSGADSTSIAKYGVRYMEIQESSASQIDTVTEATALRTAIMAETKEPTATVSLTTQYLWFAQLNDLVEIKADNLYFDTDQKLAILSRRNILSQGGNGITQLTCTGVPKAKAVGTLTRQRQFAQTRPSPSKLLTSITYGGLAVNYNFSSNQNE